MPTIYVADRDPSYRKGLAHALRQRGLEVEEFDSGPVVYARAVAADPDLIVLETDLEEMDGFQVFARLQRKHPERPYSVLFVTDFDHPRVARVCRERGAIGYVAKSRPVEHVVEAVLSALERPDPLAGRTLPAALAWLQSRGKSGRLDVEAGGQTGYVVLHKGRLLEAQWGALQGEEVLAVLADGLPGAVYHFGEGADGFDAPPPAATPREVGQGRANGAATPAPAERRSSVATTPAPAAASAGAAARPASGEPARVQKPAATAAELAPRATPASRVATAAPPPRPRPRDVTAVDPVGDREAASGGAVAALHELRRAERGRSSARRWSLAVAAVFFVLVGTAGALATLYPAYMADLREALTGGGSGAPDARNGPSGDLSLPAAGSAAAVTEAEPALPEPSPGAAPGTPQASADDGRRFDVTPGVRDVGYGRGFGPEEDAARLSVTTGNESGRSGRAVAPADAADREPSRAAGRGNARPAPERAPAVEDRPVLVTRPAPAPAAPREVPEGPAPREEAEPDLAGAAPPSPERESAPGEATPGREPTPSGGETLAPARRAIAREEGAATPQPGAPLGAAAAEPLLEKPVLLQRGDDLYYPPELRAEGVGGSVLLNIRVGANGRAQQVEVARSSGHEAFDQAAVAAVGTFLWEPGRDADGPVEAWITQAVTFRP